MGFRSGNHAMKSCVLIGGKWRHMIEDWLEEAASNFMSPVAWEEDGRVAGGLCVGII